MITIEQRHYNPVTDCSMFAQQQAPRLRAMSGTHWQNQDCGRPTPACGAKSNKTVNGNVGITCGKCYRLEQKDTKKRLKKFEEDKTLEQSVNSV